MSDPENLAVTLLVDGPGAALAESGRRVVVAVGEVDLATSPRLASVLRQASGAPGDEVIVDLSRVTFIDATGIRALVDAADAGGGRLRLRSPGPLIRKMIHLLDLDDRLPLENGTDRNAGGLDDTTGGNARV